MYDATKLMDYLEKNNFGIKGKTLFMGRVDDNLVDNFAIMVTNDQVIKEEPFSFGSRNTSYEKDTLRIIVKGNENYVATNEKVRELFRFFRNNKSINEIGLIQIDANKPVAMAKISGNTYKYNMFLDIVYDTQK